MTIEVQTQLGEFIAYFDIPDFSMSPGVILWGSRVFAKTPGRRQADPPVGQQYREVMAYTLTVRDEGAEDSEGKSDG